MPQLGHLSSITSVAFSADGRLVVTGSRDHTACLWELRTGAELRCFIGHSQDVLSVAFTSDGFVITGSRDQTARIWDPKTGTELRQFSRDGATDCDTFPIAVSPDGRRLFTAESILNFSAFAGIWDVASGKESTASRIYDGY
jgi:WD40 repeat protein